MKQLTFLLDGIAHQWSKSSINDAELRSLGSFSNEDEFFLKVQGQDERISESNPVDLTRFGIEEIYSKKKEKYRFIINDILYISLSPAVTEAEIRQKGNLNDGESIFLKVEGNDRLIAKNETVDIAPFGIEEFYSKKLEDSNVSITINHNTYNIKAGEYSVLSLKGIGNVPESHELDQIIKDELLPLEDNASVLIVGGEKFVSHVRDGASS